MKQIFFQFQLQVEKKSLCQVWTHVLNTDHIGFLRMYINVRTKLGRFMTSEQENFVSRDMESATTM